MDLTLASAVNRGTNMMPVATLAALGFGLLTVLAEESEWVDRTGDIVLFVIALVAIGWYFSGNNRFSRSLVPLSLVGLALLTKFFELALEFGDPSSIGDEFGVIPSLALIFGFTAFAFRKAGREIREKAQ